ncbi:VTT domain-containing protein [Desulfuromonas sp. TF]|uniref:VTT domain-containing protein n=1 Tax=Desulfuromonas sp. TF TaxID=1232410 RepID=UPI0004189FD5|nr:VTT domain-containing protein [Desulfuromonas sp. TF]
MSTADTELRPRLRALQADIQRDCTECGRCVGECGFLQRHGNPRQIVARLDGNSPEPLNCAFECTLCGLCTAVCPERLRLDAFFLEMRREAVDRNCGEFAAHRPLKTYEKLGTSRRFTLYRLPEGCTTIFFPGCSLSGTRPKGVKEVFTQLQRIDPQLGIVFDCCLKPSHSLGREAYVAGMFSKMTARLREQGVEEVLVACPNCHVMFAGFGDGLKVRTVWEALADADLQPPAASGTVTVHDPCVIRHAEAAQTAVRTLLRRQGLRVEEMAHSRGTTVCCGKGGGVDLLHPEMAAGWRNLRETEAAGGRMISYCAACVQALGRQTPTNHLVDVLFDPQQTFTGKKQGARAPVTYLNRLLLKRAFQRKEGFAVTRERTSGQMQENSRKRFRKPLILLAILVAAASAMQVSDAPRFQPERLQELIAGSEGLAPALYMLIYALAPVLFLPALPLTIVGGLLFGPVWGVVYTMIGATTGASLAFLCARYLARDWVSAKLTGSKLERLDREVAEHGWKVVAFTRLIPAFPFNLLNYALGLTKIPFSHYFVTTFVCMLPACIAFIVFSSSLFDLVHGSLSPRALLGISLVALVSLLPVGYRCLQNRRKGVA